MPIDIGAAVSGAFFSTVGFFATPLGTALLAPIGSFAAGALGVWVTTRTVRHTHKERIEADGRLAERKFDFDTQLADKKFALDARQADRKRRQDLAEEVLTGFYEVRHRIAAVRSSAAFGDEGQGRPHDDNEPDELRRTRDSYYVPIARLLQHNDTISVLLSKRFRMVAWFGPDAERPFLRINEAVNGIAWAANNLIRHVTTQPQPRSWLKWETMIWAGADDPDAIQVDLDAAVAEIEAICRPILQESAQQ